MECLAKAGYKGVLNILLVWQCVQGKEKNFSFTPSCPIANCVFLVSVVSISDRVLVLLETGIRELSEIFLVCNLNRQSAIQTQHKCKEE